MKATFAAGCVWHVVEGFSKIPGVKSTRFGYTGGKTTNPTYRDVCTDKTGHAEAVEIDYDPAEVSYEQLLDVFWNLHDPTTLHRQGPDVGTQYRSAIFYHNEEQKRAAIESRDRQQASGRHGGRKIVTEISPASEFWQAEDYHQRYFEKRGVHSCGIC